MSLVRLTHVEPEVPAAVRGEREERVAGEDLRVVAEEGSKPRELLAG